MSGSSDNSNLDMKARIEKLLRSMDESEIDRFVDYLNSFDEWCAGAVYYSNVGIEDIAFEYETEDSVLLVARVRRIHDGIVFVDVCDVDDELLSMFEKMVLCYLLGG